MFVFKSGFLQDDELETLWSASLSLLLLWKLYAKHYFVDFCRLREPLPVDQPAHIVMQMWSRMFTACLLHYNLDIPSAVRFVGGIHTGAHRDWTKLEPHL